MDTITGEANEFSLLRSWVTFQQVFIRQLPILAYSKRLEQFGKLWSDQFLTPHNWYTTPNIALEVQSFPFTGRPLCESFPPLVDSFAKICQGRASAQLWLCDSPFYFFLRQMSYAAFGKSEFGVDLGSRSLPPPNTSTHHLRWVGLLGWQKVAPRLHKIRVPPN